MNKNSCLQILYPGSFLSVASSDDRGTGYTTKITIKRNTQNKNNNEDENKQGTAEILISVVGYSMQLSTFGCWGVGRCSVIWASAVWVLEKGQRMKNELTRVMDIQSNYDYEHKPGIKNRILRNMRKYEFQFAQYRDRYTHGDVSVTDKEILKNKMKESEAKYEYYSQSYDSRYRGKKGSQISD